MNQDIRPALRLLGTKILLKTSDYLARFGPIDENDDTLFSRVVDNRYLSQEQKKILFSHGFTPYPKEWWHFTLAHERYPDMYFDFPIIEK